MRISVLFVHIHEHKLTVQTYFSFTCLTLYHTPIHTVFVIITTRKRSGVAHLHINEGTHIQKTQRTKSFTNATQGAARAKEEGREAPEMCKEGGRKG